MRKDGCEMTADCRAIVEEERPPLYQRLPLSTPLGLTISTCNYCDFQCVYCALSGKQRAPAILTWETFSRMVNQLAEFPAPIKQISFVANGETILNQQLPEMIAALKQQKLAEHVKVISNGNRLTHQYADRLIAAGLDILKISLQGMSAEKYQQVCKTHIDFDRFQEQIQYFYQHRGNCKLHLKIIDIALEPGEEQLFYDTFGAIADVIFIEECIGEHAKDNKLLRHNKLKMNTDGMEICSLPFFTFFIDELGNVFPCCEVNRYSAPVAQAMGNIHRQSIRSLWEHEFLDLQASLLGRKTPTCALCRGCNRYPPTSKDSDILDGHEQEILARMQMEDTQ